MTERINDEFLEKIMTKSMLVDKQFLVLLANVFEPHYFTQSVVSKIFECAKKHLEEYNQIPPRDVIINTLNDENVSEFFEELDSIDFNVSQNYDYLISNSNIYLKDQAIKQALVDSVDIVESNGETAFIRQKIEDALAKDLLFDLGLPYFGMLGERLKRIFTASEIRIPTYFPLFDEYINGGFPALTLSVLVAQIHGFKSNTMANWASRQVLHGHNVVLLTLEMSQDMFAERFDSIFSNLDIGRMYQFDEQKKELVKRLKELKNQNNHGDIYIKQFPTGSCSVKDFRIYLRELKIRDIIPDIIYVDYINLMKSALKKSDDLYSSIKSVAEELRALSFEFGTPVVSVSQLNRAGGFVGFEELDFHYIAESMGVPATADFMAVLGKDEDKLIYENELGCKILKNRLGGRIGEVLNLYVDDKSLKMYDESEFDFWQQNSIGNTGRRRTEGNTGRRRTDET